MTLKLASLASLLFFVPRSYCKSTELTFFRVRKQNFCENLVGFVKRNCTNGGVHVPRRARCSVLAERAAETVHGRYTNLKGLDSFARAPGDTYQSLAYPDNLPAQSFGEFLKSMHSAFQREDDLPTKQNQALWNLIINVRDGQRNRSEQDAGKARYTSERELVMEYMQSGWSRVWTARNWARIEVWPGWLRPF